MDINEQIEHAIRSTGKTQAEVARDIKKSTSLVSDIVRRDKALIPKTLIDVLQGFGLELTVQPVERDE